jgi:hypothetical protein
MSKVVSCAFVLALLFLVAACSTAPTPTAAPIPTIAPTQAPTRVAPTVAPTTTAPSPATATVLPTSASTPTTAATTLPTARPTSTPAVAPGLYVTNLRTDPNPPLRGTDLYFYPTFLNSTGTPQNYRWNVFLFRPDNLNTRFGEATRTDSSIPQGSGEFKSVGGWKIPVGGPCENFVARVVFFDQNNQPQTFNKPDGTPFQKDLTVCALIDLPNYPTPSPVPPTPTITPGPGVFATDIRTQPDPPVRNIELNFFVTFVNTTGNAKNLKWVVLIYRPGEPNAFGQTTGATSTIYSAVAETQSAGFWKLSGGGPCENFVARAVWFNEENKPVLFTTFDGKPLEKNLTVCP